MGSQDGKQLEKRDKKSAARSDRLGRIRNSGGSVSGEASWGEVDPRLVARLVYAVTSSGGAVMFAVTSDGGAYSLTFFDNGDRERVYIPKTAHLEAEFEGLIALWAE